MYKLCVRLCRFSINLHSTDLTGTPTKHASENKVHWLRCSHLGSLCQLLVSSLAAGSHLFKRFFVAFSVVEFDELRKKKRSFLLILPLRFVAFRLSFVQQIPSTSPCTPAIASTSFSALVKKGENISRKQLEELKFARWMGGRKRRKVETIMTGFLARKSFAHLGS